MIFLLEQYLKQRKAKITSYERRRDDWIAESEYGYRTAHSYLSKEPYPVVKFDKILNALLLAVLAAVIVSGVTVTIFNHDVNKQDEKSNAAQEVKQKSKDFKVGDTVQVVYGTFKDSVGVIVKDKGDGEGAIIKLTKSTMTKEMCKADNNCGNDYGQDNGSLLSVNTDSNLVAYKEVKK